MSVKFHFLNVGDGDCTIIDFPDRVVTDTNQEKDARIMMVDIHHHDEHDEYEHVINYYKENFRDSTNEVRPIFRYVTTHPHKDHIKGIRKLFEEIEVLNFWDIEHNFQPQKSGSDWEEHKEDWEFYERTRTSKSNPKTLQLTDANNPQPYWNEDRIEILAPSKELYDFVHTKEDGTKCTAEEIGQRLNDLSYVLLIRVNGLKILLAGDAEQKSWEYILKHHKEKIKNIDILGAPHHGRESAFHEEAVKIMNPRYIIFSVAEDCEHIVPEKYQEAAPRATIFKTYEWGSLVFECDFEGNIKIT